MIGLETATEWLEISPPLQQQAWQASQAIAIPGLRWQTYLNHLCLHTVIDWVAEKLGTVPTIAPPNTPGLWTLVNGSAIAIGQRRIVLIPTEAMDQEELRVPQEWIDQPDWLGDYYLAIEVDAEAQALHIWGYSTHEQIKTQGVYDASDRTYSLDGQDLIPDMTVFWVMQQLPAEPTRASVAPLPPLTNEQASALLTHLSQPSLALPRLEPAPAEWLALLSHDLWLRQLGEPRLHELDASGDRPTVQLSQWLQQVFEAGWQTLGEAFQMDPPLALGLRQGSAPATGVTRVKSVVLDPASPPLRLELTVSPEADGRRRIQVQLSPAMAETYLPPAVQLLLKSRSGQPIQTVMAGAESQLLQLRPMKCEVGQLFQLQVSLADYTVTEFVMA
jgi:hypothetical protein